MGYSLNTFYDRYNNLGETNEPKFKRIVNKLLGSNFIVFMKEDDKADYNFLKNNQDLFSSFFDLIGFSLIYRENAYFFIKNELELIANRYLLKKEEILILLILKKLYIEFNDINKIDNIPYTKINDIVNRYRPITSNKDIKKTNILNILRMFRRRKIIDFKGDLTLNSDLDIKIYPTINEIVKEETLTDLENKINDYNLENRGNDNDLSN